jgi:hypothetical protein
MGFAATVWKSSPVALDALLYWDNLKTFVPRIHQRVGTPLEIRRPMGVNRSFDTQCCKQQWRTRTACLQEGISNCRASAE